MQATEPSPNEREDVSPLDALGRRWDARARARLDTLLARHGDGLSPVEREVFTPDPGTSPAAAREMRRALVRRLLRVAGYRRRGAALASWRGATPMEGGPAGPYNSYAALEQLVRRVAAGRPAWAAEFLDVYAEMQSIRKSYGELTGKK